MNTPVVADGSWMEDPRIARTMARFSWVVLVVGFVLLARNPLEPTLQRAALGGLIAVIAVMNVPVVLGLYGTRAQARSAAYRAVAISLGLRVLATIAVVALVAR